MPSFAPIPVISSAPAGRMAGGRAIFLGRACGLAAGTVLACGSVLAGATHLGDGSPAPDSATPLPTTTDPDATAGAAEPRADTPAEPAFAAPDVVRVQAVSEPSPPRHTQLGPVRRNSPVALDMPADEPVQNPSSAERSRQSPPSAAAPDPAPAPQDPITPVRPAPVSPVLDPAAEGVGRVAPVGGVLPSNDPSVPNNPRQVRTDSPREIQNRETQRRSSGDDRAVNTRDKRADRTTRGPVGTVKKVVAPVDNAVSQTIEPVKPVLQPATRPAMTMLGSLLPIG